MNEKFESFGRDEESQRLEKLQEIKDSVRNIYDPSLKIDIAYDNPDIKDDLLQDIVLQLIDYKKTLISLKNENKKLSDKETKQIDDVLQLVTNNTQEAVDSIESLTKKNIALINIIRSEAELGNYKYEYFNKISHHESKNRALSDLCIAAIKNNNIKEFKKGLSLIDKKTGYLDITIRESMPSLISQDQIDLAEKLYKEMNKDQIENTNVSFEYSIPEKVLVFANRIEPYLVSIGGETRNSLLYILCKIYSKKDLAKAKEYYSQIEKNSNHIGEAAYSYIWELMRNKQSDEAFKIYLEVYDKKFINNVHKQKLDLIFKKKFDAYKKNQQKVLEN